MQLVRAHSRAPLRGSYEPGPPWRTALTPGLGLDMTGHEYRGKRDPSFDWDEI
jgi:hypothetical protein